MLSADLALRVATPDDLDAIMAIERGEGFEALVARSSREGHLATMCDARHAYFVGESDGVEAFAILRDVRDPHGNVYLKRIAVRTPGRGIGARFLSQVLDAVFAASPAHRFHLDCFDDNFRAQAMYAKLGFTRDGVLREAYLDNGRRRDLIMMALTRPEWLSRAARAP